MTDRTLPKNPSEVMEATENFVTDLNGEQVVILAGTTRVAADHELVKRYPDWFKPLELSYRSEDMTAEPGARRNRQRQPVEE
jgi:hypothetical protein